MIKLLLIGLKILKKRCKKIYENSSEWFENELSKDDIENSFLPCIKPYKSGQWYLLRCNTPILTGNLTQNSLKIYNEENEDLEMNDITSENELITIIQVSDIKFTSKNFQLDFVIKQVMVLNDTNINNNKLIKLDDESSDNNNTLINKEDLKLEELDTETIKEDNNDTENTHLDTDKDNEDKIAEKKLKKL